jgi:hypothetical protein
MIKVESTGTITTNILEGECTASAASFRADSSYRCSTLSYNSM